MIDKIISYDTVLYIFTGPMKRNITDLFYYTKENRRS